MEEENDKCKECRERYKEKLSTHAMQIKEHYEEQLKAKPSTIQIIAFGVSCFALGVSMAEIFT